MAATSILKNNQKDMLAELRNIIYQCNTEAILPFLENYQQSNITVLKETLKQARRYWEDGKDFPNNFEFNPEHNDAEEYYRRPYDKNRSIALVLLSFALLNLSDINTTWYSIYTRTPNIIKDDSLLNILKKINCISKIYNIRVQKLNLLSISMINKLIN